ncbi:MAG TPA: hypothetical protein VE955_04820 [Candidatus Dormibacteraeota bacterium]|jgi:hypothetical protein|nr:hypothetical protein [Candidatus Dormibacteraeota bacterium]
MGLRLTLQNGSGILLDVPLSEDEWNTGTKELISRELDGSEADLDALCEICDFFSNKRRVQMLNHLVKDCNNSASFTDLLKVAVNPKYISDLVNRRASREIVVKDGKGYSLSPLGLGSFLLLSLATRKLLRETDSTNGDDKSFEGQ